MNENRIKARFLEEDEAAINGAIGALLQHREGRKYLWWTLQVGRVATQPYTRNALDTAFACGELNVGQQFLERIISVSPDGYVEMMKEMADERTQRDAELAGAGRGPDRGDSADSADT